jgi:hypothetical protein
MILQDTIVIYLTLSGMDEKRFPEVFDLKKYWIP